MPSQWALWDPDTELAVLPNEEAAGCGCRFTPAWSTLNFAIHLVGHLGPEPKEAKVCCFLPQFTHLLGNSGFFD